MTQRIALISAGVVANVIMADDAFLAHIQDQHDEFVTLADDTPCNPGWAWDGQVFTDPNPPQPAEVIQPPIAAPVRRISVGSFFDRFGEQKWQILASANPLVQALVKDCSVRKHINLDDPQLLAGLQLLVQSGFAIDPQTIVSAPVTADEAP